MGNSSQAIPGYLYLVPTPIGNLADISARALGILQTVDLIAAEDTRHTGRLLQHCQISTRQISFHQHNTQQRIPELVELLQAEKSIALVTDAGMPGISDPGYELVVACIDAAIPVIPLPGPNAALTALIASGLPTNRFIFEGFLPTKPKVRHETLQAWAKEPRTIIFYESPHRLPETLTELISHLGPVRQIVIARELTKLYEEFWRGTLGEAISYFQTHPAKGELTIILAGSTPTIKTHSSEDIKTALQHHFQQGLSPSQASRELALEMGLSRRYVYGLALELNDEFSAES
ncbi:16S rRNA (cytidine(1402)-2'-O)-methyltransferase [Thermosynechococcaceae cyanobacterium BACA0444]|uniref:Ribosomal RNA small subunit methyltransferase I n=1 Tax=Pseudocalidococcus azoricus BACA0444 TaxID=2918990 RepID=A0AAE4JZK8_9CYAN|nr:16S rRNA (cytidine(1402)-2'-O)-methyltransferase [Pseudocalidococcus azoricus]MDS3862244.1 16S rRNA (cytidine(1402)-2'-O)-methyltransferase [Pseudocalidococcus azoricus BACA0444]